MSTGPLLNPVDYGATGDGSTPDTAALQAAIDACSTGGGGTVWVPAGSYLTGSLFLRSHVTLHIDAGARLLGSDDPAHYPVIHSRWEGVDRETHAPLLGGTRLEQVAITGRGTVDGQGAPWWQRHRAGSLRFPRPRLISLQDCRNVLVEGITAVNSPSWTITPLRCENVTVDGVTIINPPDSPNTDGINPDSCRNVRIANCHIDVGDDCVTIKSGTEANDRRRRRPCENIAVTNCTMVHGHGGVVIGSEMSGDVRNVVISNCIFDGTDRGIRFKSRRGRGGIVEDVRVTNIVMRDVLCPITVNLYYAVGVWGNPLVADKQPRPLSDDTPAFRRIHVSHITARDVRLAAGFVFGLPERPLEDFSLSDVSILLAPSAEAGYPEMADGLERMQRAGLYMRNIVGLRLHNVSIHGQLGPALTLMEAAEVDINAFGTRTPPPAEPVILMRDVVGALVRGCRAGADAALFLQLEGDRSRAIALDGNFLAPASTAVLSTNGARPEAVVSQPAVPLSGPHS